MSRIDKVKELQEICIKNFEKENKNVYRIQLTILKAITDNGYIDTAQHRFIEIWNQQCDSNEEGWHPDNKIL